MKLNKNELLSFLSLIENAYEGLSKKPLSQSELFQYTTVLVKTCKLIQPVYQDNSNFKELLTYAHQLLTKQKDVHLVRHKQNKILLLLSNYVLNMLNDADFHLYLYDCDADETLMNHLNMKSVTKIAELPHYIGNKHEISVLVYDDKKREIDMNRADIVFPLTYILELREKSTTTLSNVDYFTYIRLYLEAKLTSLKERPDIQLLLAGSSYTMCGLFEKQMPIPARNIAVDAQDIYYSIESVRKSLEYNPNITHVVLSFAYYLWGTDISLSNSDEHQPRIREINYPIFKDKHNFKNEIDELPNPLLMSATPLQKFFHPFELWADEKTVFVNDLFRDSHYFLKPREGSAALRFDEQTNLQFAQQLTDKHGRVIGYETTIQKNLLLFSNFLQEMNEKGVDVLVYVPPMNEYYRRCLNPDLISDFYKLMTPLKDKYKFKLIDLYGNNTFEHADFFDYDHLNDQGAKKMGEIIIKELDFKNN